MIVEVGSWLGAVGVRLLPLLLLYLLPIAAYVAQRGAFTFTRRAILPVAWLGLAFAAVAAGVPTGQLCSVVVGVLYYTGVALLAPWAVALLRVGRTSALAIFVSAVVLCLALPSVLMPGAAASPALVLGWEMTFSFYSYCVEVAKRDGERPSRAWRDALFFIMVDPVLLFPQRSRPGAVKLTRVFKCCGMGLGLVSLSTLLMTPIIVPTFHASVALWSPLSAVILSGLIRCLIAYWGQAGLISIRIGLLQAAGFHAPECFHNPLGARNPLDFWRRWNIYVGSWLRWHVFVPLAAELRVWRWVWLERCVCVLATFVACGLIHDAFGSARRLSLNLNFTEQFLLVAAFVLLWAGADGCLAALGRRFRLPLLSRLTRRLGGRAAVAAGVLLLPFVWGNTW